MKKLPIIIAACAAVFGGTLSADTYDTPVAESELIWANVPDALKQAKWIWPTPGSWGYDITNSYAAFRKTFKLDAVPRKATMYITADQSYRLYINGKFVCNGPARGYQRSWPFDEIDVSKYLQKGENLIAARVYNPGRHTFSYVFEGRAGLLFALDMGKAGVVRSDSSVQARRQTGCRRDTAPYSVQMANQEHIDLREENPDWINLGFSQKGWNKGAGTSTGEYNAMPYYMFEERGIPMNGYREIPMKSLVAEGEGASIADSFDVRNAAELVSKEGMKLSKAVGKEMSSITVAPTEKGRQRSYLIDFGKVVVGIPIFKIEGANGGEIIDTVMAEYYKKDFEIDNPYNTGSMRALANRMVCRKGDFTTEFFALQGFRYMLVRVRNNSAELKITPIMRWAAYPLEDNGEFKVSNENAQKIWEASRHTEKVCSLDAFVDTPLREQAQWWGDARVQAWNTFFISGDTRLLRRGIRSIASQQVPNGLTYGHAPTFAHSCILPDFSLTWILTLYDYYWQTGSIEPFVSHKNVVDGIISYFENMKDPRTGLVKYDPRYWLFLDWTGIQKEGQPAILNHWYLQALDKLTQMCRQSNYLVDAKRYENLARSIRASIAKYLIDSEGYAIDGILPDGKSSNLRSIQAQVMAKMNSVEGFDFEKAKNNIVLPYLRGEIKTHAVPSSYWAVYVFKTMVDAGHQKEVYNFILKNWKEMGEYGSTFENYDASKMSHSHAWSAHPAFILPDILSGVKQTGAGWSSVSVNPSTTLEDEYRIVYPTPRGKITVEKKAGQKPTVMIPASINSQN